MRCHVTPKLAKMAKVAKNTGAGVIAIFAAYQASRGRTKNLGSMACCFVKTEILRLRAQNDTGLPGQIDTLGG
jgi:ribosomal protein L14